MSARFAIYLAPPAGSPLECFARSWLGRDHVTGEPAERLEVDGIAPDRLDEITRSPRHYGFHATIKAPFELAANTTGDELEQAARTFAATRKAFRIRLTPGSLGGFLALLPAEDSAPLNNLAAACVRHFEPFRAPLTGMEIERRRRSPLTPRQDVQMLKWGYPYVFEDFHFHMTLTDRLAEPERQYVLDCLHQLTADLLAEPLEVREIAIYGQTARHKPFTLLERLPFG